MLWHSSSAHRAAIIRSSCAALAVSLALPLAAANLILNGRFEGPDTEGVPQNWSFHNWREDQIASGEVTGGGNVGTRCLHLTSPVFPADYCAYCRPVDASEWAGSEVVFSCYYRTTDHPQAQVTIATYTEAFTEREFDTPELQSEALPLGESDHWRLVTWRVTCKPHSKELVVLLRLMGGGSVFFDGVALQPVGSEVEVELKQAGTIVAMPNTRTVECRVHNSSHHATLIRLNTEARLAEDRTVSASAECTLQPDQSQRLEANYGLDFKEPHELLIRVMGAEPDEVHQAYERSVAGLVDARIIQPAFRSSLLSTIPTDEIVVEGHLNASEQIMRKTEVSAELVGTGARAGEPVPLSDEGMMGPWRLTLSSEGILTGKHEVQVKARVERGAEHVLSLPLLRPPRADAQVAYDTRHRLWVHGQPVFPLGMCGVTRPEALPAMREAGLNFVTVPSTTMSTLYAEAAQEAGMHVAIASPSFDLEVFWRLLRDKYFDHPALMGWYGLERPDLQAAFPNRMGEIYAGLAELDPHHPVLLALRPNASLEAFARACDIVLVWTDPVPRWPITTVADDIRRAIEATGGHKPVWALIQSTGLAWTEVSRLDPKESGRPPTAAEHRAMTYLALISGADGLVYYAYRVPRQPWTPSYHIERDAPELWEGIKQTNAQLASLAPVLCGADPEPIEMTEDSPIRVAAWRYEEARYLIAVNPSSSGAAVTLDLGLAAGQEVPVLFEERAVIATDTGLLADAFDPYEVHVYLKKG